MVVRLMERQSLNSKRFEPGPFNPLELGQFAGGGLAIWTMAVGA
jgi:hypothetical protein